MIGGLNRMIFARIPNESREYWLNTIDISPLRISRYNGIIH